MVDPAQPLELFDPEATWKRKTITDFTVRELLVPIFQSGELVYRQPSIEMRTWCAGQIDTLWDEVKRFENPHNYYVDLSQSCGTSSTSCWQSAAEAVMKTPPRTDAGARGRFHVPWPSSIVQNQVRHLHEHAFWRAFIFAASGPPPGQVKRRAGGNAGDQLSQITTQTGADLRQGVQIHLCDPALDLADVAHGNLELFGQPLLGRFCSRRRPLIRCPIAA